MYTRVAKKSRKRFFTYGLIFANIAIVSIVAVLIFSSKNKSYTVSDSDYSLQTDDTVEIAALDQLSATDIASTIANAVEMDEAISVQNQADSEAVQLNLIPVDNVAVAKPQILVNTAETKTRKDIIQYDVKSGDTVESIAVKFGLSASSIRWSNGLTGSTVRVGTKLWIPPRNGIVYEVKASDSIAVLAAKYRASKEQVISFNDIESSGLPIGERIVIPDGILPDQARKVTTRSAITPFGGFSFGTTALYGGNGYNFGYCTWHAANRRLANGQSIPRNLGNAITWFSAAQRAGMATGTKPQKGAIVWFRYATSRWGHVAYIESVASDGSSFTLSEMNGRAGWNRLSSYSVPASEYDKYRFIY